MIRYLCWIFTVLAVGSLFLWAGFDITWWKPIEGDYTRAHMLFLLHVVGLLAGPVSEGFR